MSQEVRAFDRAKKGTWGAQSMYDLLGCVIARSKINEVLDERRNVEGRVKRPQARRYEFVAPQVTNSADFIAVRPRGRVLRVQDNRARFTLGFAHQDHWQDAEVAQFVEGIFAKHGSSLFFKHDLGGEFRGADFQSMLRRHNKVIAVPSPPYYPKFNGNIERSNLAARKWIAPTESDRPTLARVIEQLTQAQVLQYNMKHR
jgi:hypothetical protein